MVPVLQSGRLPSRGRQSSPPWWCTGTQWAWQTKNCRSWWCHCWDLASPPCKQYHWAGNDVHVLTQHMAWALLLQGHLEAESKTESIDLLLLHDKSWQKVQPPTLMSTCFKALHKPSVATVLTYCLLLWPSLEPLFALFCWLCMFADYM